MMATACSDRFVRVYDRRNLSLRLPSAARPSRPLLELCPLHLNLPGHKASLVYTTCARFSHRGDQVVATYHREQVCHSPQHCVTATPDRVPAARLQP